MFSDPNTALMALVILNFVGTFFMFLFVMRSQDNTQKVLMEQYSHMQIRLVEMEQRITELTSSAKDNNLKASVSMLSEEGGLASMLESHAARARASSHPRPAARPEAAPARSDAALPDILSLDMPGEAKKTVAAQSDAASLNLKLG